MENKNLGELVRMCGDEFHSLNAMFLGPKWQALAWIRKDEKTAREGLGDTPEEATYKLYLNLQK